MLERWREGDVFERSLANREGAEVWSFYEGPPTANGRPGSHHVLARVFKDVYPRYKTMCGYRVPRKAGWDCHGLPVELEVEKQLGISSKQEIEELRDRRVQPALPRVGLRVRRGVEPADRADRLLDRPRRPLRHPRGRLHRVGLVVAAQALGRGPPLRGPQGRPLLPALRHRALLARGGAGLQGRRGPLHIRALPAARRRRRRGGESLLVWTTTPWTLPGNVAVAVAPDVTYVRAEVDGETLILAEPLVEKVLGEGAEVVDRFPGADLVGRRYRGPVFELADGGPADAFRVLAGDFVTTEDGTGLVHIAPAFGEDDYAVAAANGIFDPTDARHPLQPGRPRRHLRPTRVSGFEGRFVKDPEVTARADRRPRAPRPALPRAGLRARLPALLALRHAAPLLRQVELVRRHLAGPRAAARQQREDRLAPRAHQARPLRQMAGEQRRLGALPRPLLGHAAADLGVRRRGLRRPLLRRLGRRAARARRAARSPTTCTAPTSTRSRSTASAAAARCAGSSR